MLRCTIMPLTPQKARRISLYFRVSIFVKGFLSVVEILGGLLAVFVPVSFITHLMVRLAQGELISDPSDFIATHLVMYAHQLSLAGSVFISVYLLSRGIIKLALVVALYKNKLWAYPVSLVVLGLFVIYEFYRIFLNFSPLIIAFTIFDLFVMWSIWAEYRAVRAHLLS